MSTGYQPKGPKGEPPPEGWSPNPSGSGEARPDDLSHIKIDVTVDGDALARETHRQEYERIVADLRALCKRSGMAAAIMMTELDDDGRPHIDDVGLRSVREVLAPLGYEVVKRDDQAGRAALAGHYWEAVVNDAHGLRDLADSLRARCPGCGAPPVLRLRHDLDPPSLYLDCRACGQYSVDGGDGVEQDDEAMMSGLRTVGRIWLREMRGVVG